MIEVKLVGNETLACEGLRRILDEYTGSGVVGQALGLGEGSEKAREPGPDVMVVDPTLWWSDATLPNGDHPAVPGRSQGALRDSNDLIPAR